MEICGNDNESVVQRCVSRERHKKYDQRSISLNANNFLTNFQIIFGSKHQLCLNLRTLF